MLQYRVAAAERLNYPKKEGVLHMFKRLLTATALALCACGASPVVRVGEGKIPKIEGDKTFSLGTLVCGMPISDGNYTVTTRDVNGGADCEYSFDQLVEVVRASDYQQIPDLMGAGNLVQAVEIKVETLSFSDASNNMPIDYNDAARVKSLALNVEGQQVADKATLSKLPATVPLSGTALTNIKTKVDARQPASVHATAILVVAKMPPLPAQLKVVYKAQPTLVLGTGSVNLGQ